MWEEEWESRKTKTFGRANSGKRPIIRGDLSTEEHEEKWAKMMKERKGQKEMHLTGNKTKKVNWTGEGGGGPTPEEERGRREPTQIKSCPEGGGQLVVPGRGRRKAHLAKEPGGGLIDAEGEMA